MSKNIGHGHVSPRPDGVKARCGGPGLCMECSLEADQKKLEGLGAFDKTEAKPALPHVWMYISDLTEEDTRLYSYRTPGRSAGTVEYVPATELSSLREELRSAIEGLSKNCGSLEVENNSLKAEAEKLTTKNKRLRKENERLRKALETVLHQPFQGSWDAQATFVSAVLCQTNPGAERERLHQMSVDINAAAGRSIAAQFTAHVGLCLNEGIVTREQLAREFTVGMFMVDKWAAGTGIPHPAVRKSVLKFLAKMVVNKLESIQ